MVDKSRCNRPCLQEQGTTGNERTLLRKLQTIDFALAETVLYLNAYPNSSAALAYYHKLVSERNKLVDELSRLGKPITCMDNTSADTWRWTEGPWPWQPDAN